MPALGDAGAGSGAAGQPSHAATGRPTAKPKQKWRSDPEQNSPTDRRASTTGETLTSSRALIHMWGQNDRSQLNCVVNEEDEDSVRVLLEQKQIPGWEDQMKSAEAPVVLSKDTISAGVSVVRITCGWDFTAMITRKENSDDTSLYTWGDGRFGQLGVNLDDPSNDSMMVHLKPHPVDVPPEAAKNGGRWLYVSAGRRHCVAIIEFPSVQSTTETSQIRMESLSLDGDDSGAGGGNNMSRPQGGVGGAGGGGQGAGGGSNSNSHSANPGGGGLAPGPSSEWIERRNEVYSWGNDGNGQLGMGNYYTIDRSHVSDDMHKSIRNQTILQCKSVWSTPRRVYIRELEEADAAGLAGIPDTPCLSPDVAAAGGGAKKNKGRSDGPLEIVRVECGCKHTAAIDSRGGLWTWGCNTRSQLGRPSRGSPRDLENEPACKYRRMVMRQHLNETPLNHRRHKMMRQDRATASAGLVDSWLRKIPYEPDRDPKKGGLLNSGTGNGSIPPAAPSAGKKKRRGIETGDGGDFDEDDYDEDDGDFDMERGGEGDGVMGYSDVEDGKRGAVGGRSRAGMDNRPKPRRVRHGGHSPATSVFRASNGSLIDMDSVDGHPDPLHPDTNPDVADLWGKFRVIPGTGNDDFCPFPVHVKVFADDAMFNKTLELGGSITLCKKAEVMGHSQTPTPTPSPSRSTSFTAGNAGAGAASPGGTPIHNAASVVHPMQAITIHFPLVKGKDTDGRHGVSRRISLPDEYLRAQRANHGNAPPQIITEEDGGVLSAPARDMRVRWLKPPPREWEEGEKLEVFRVESTEVYSVIEVRGRIGMSQPRGKIGKLTPDDEGYFDDYDSEDDTPNGEGDSPLPAESTSPGAASSPGGAARDRPRREKGRFITASFENPGTLPEKRVQFQSLACGLEHSCALSNDGQVYMWGCGESLQLGSKKIHVQYFPTKLHLLEGLQFRSISAGFYHTVAVTDFGDVYAWGMCANYRLGYERGSSSSGLDEVGMAIQEEEGGDGGLGAGGGEGGGMGEESNEKKYEEQDCLPKPIAKLKRKDIVDISCGGAHCVAVARNGEMYSWGANSHGQLCINPHITSQNGPQSLHLPDSFSHVAAGRNFTCVVTKPSCGSGGATTTHMHKIMMEKELMRDYSASTTLFKEMEMSEDEKTHGIFAQDAEGMTPLHYAVKHSCLPAVEYILQKPSQMSQLRRAASVFSAAGNGARSSSSGNSVNTQAEQEALAPERSGRHGRGFSHLRSSVGQVVQAQKDITYKISLRDLRRLLTIKNTRGQTVIHSAIESAGKGASGAGFDVINTLIQAEEDLAKVAVDVASKGLFTSCYGGHRDARGRTPLFLACHFGFVKLVEKLVSHHKPPLYTPDVNFNTPLHEACKRGQMGVVHLLFAEFIKDQRPIRRTGFRAMMMDADVPKAPGGGGTIVPPFAMNNSRGETPLHCCCLPAAISPEPVEGKENKDKQVKGQGNGEGNGGDGGDEYSAAQSSNSSSSTVFGTSGDDQQNRLECAKEIIKLANEFNNGKRIETVKPVYQDRYGSMFTWLLWLLENEDRAGNTALQLAMKVNENKPLVELLVHSGSYLMTQNNIGETPLHEAMRVCNKELAMLLMQSGLAEHGRHDKVSLEGKTPLYLALENEFDPGVELMMSQETPANVWKGRLAQSRSPMNFAVQNFLKNETASNFLKRPDVQKLVSDKFDEDVRGSMLMSAALYLLMLIIFLLFYGTEVNIRGGTFFGNLMGKDSYFLFDHGKAPLDGNSDFGDSHKGCGLTSMSTFGNDVFFDWAEACLPLSVNLPLLKVGAIRVSQQRVIPEVCSSTWYQYSGMYKGGYEQQTCNYSFTKKVASQDGFGGEIGRQWSHSEDASSETDAFLPMNDDATYPSGGFYFDIPPVHSEALQVLNTSRYGGFVDLQTRAILIDYTLFSPNLNLACICRIVLRITEVGNVVVDSSSYFTVTELFPRYDLHYVFQSMFVAGLVLYSTFFMTRSVLRKFNADYRSAVADVWNKFDLAMSLTGLAIAIIRVIRASIQGNLSVYLAQTNYADLNYLARVAEYNRIAYAFFGIFAFLKLLWYLRLNQKLGQLVIIILEMITDMVTFFQVFTIFWVAFSLAYHVMYGTTSSAYNTFASALSSELRVVYGDDGGYDPLFDASPAINSILFFLYFLMAFVLLLNLLIAMLSTSYEEVMTNAASKYACEQAKMVLDVLLVQASDLKKLTVSEREEREAGLIGEGKTAKKTAESKGDAKARIAARQRRNDLQLQDQADDSKATKERVTNLGKEVRQLLTKHDSLKDQISTLQKTVTDGMSKLEVNANQAEPAQESAPPPMRPAQSAQPVQPVFTSQLARPDTNLGPPPADPPDSPQSPASDNMFGDTGAHV